MILRRLAIAIREQKWFTALIEFVIVVAGIFIGLQVDGWNQVRKDRELEQDYLVRLADDIQSDINTFQSLEQVFEVKAKTIQSLRESPVSELLVASRDEFLQNLDFTTWIAMPASRSATFSELAGSGRLVLIRNLQLRGALSTYYAEYELISDILDQPIGDYRQLIFEAIPGERYYDWRLSEDIGDLREIEQALLKLQADPRFEAAANAEVAYATSMIYWLREHRGRARHVLELLQSSD